MGTTTSREIPDTPWDTFLKEQEALLVEANAARRAGDPNNPIDQRAAALEKVAAEQRAIVEAKAAFDDTGQFTEMAIGPPTGVIITMKDQTAPAPHVRLADTMEVTPGETWVEIFPRASGKTSKATDTDATSAWEGGRSAQGQNPRSIAWEQQTLVTHDLDEGLVTEQSFGKPYVAEGGQQRQRRSKHGSETDRRDGSPTDCERGVRAPSIITENIA